MLDLKSIVGKNITIQDWGIVLAKNDNYYTIEFIGGNVEIIKDLGDFKIGQEVVYALQSGIGSEPKTISEIC